MTDFSKKNFIQHIILDIDTFSNVMCKKKWVKEKGGLPQRAIKGLCKVLQLEVKKFWNIKALFL